MKGFVNAVGTLLLIVTPSAAAAQGEARPIPLDEAVRLAQRNAPATVQARNALSTNAATVRQRYAAYVPTLSFGSNVSRQVGTRFVADLNEFRPNPQPWRGGHSFNSSIDLFNGRRLFDLQSARSNLDAAEATEVTQTFTVALQVKQQYYGVLAAREQRAAADKQLEQAEQQLRASTARVAAGAATRSDSLRSSIQVGNARLAILTADNAIATANAALSRLVGTESIVTAVANDTSDTGEIALSDADLLALAERGPAVRQARAQHAAALQSSRSSKTLYLPRVSASVGWAYSAADTGIQFLGDKELRNTTTRLTVNFPLLDGLSRETQVATASANADNARVQLRDAELNARQQMIQQLGAYRTAQARVEIQLETVAAGEEDLRVQQERYNLGASTLLDLLSSQTTLDQARRDLIQARLDARTAKAQIETLIGRDL
ncbi:MAG: TolC family protein [Gemmatimonadaceae bacterium]